MQGIEKTLRDTLGKLDSPNETTRIKLYKATETILERSLAPYIESQPEMVAARRTQLHEIVTRLESEYQISAPIAETEQEPQKAASNDVGVEAVPASVATVTPNEFPVNETQKELSERSAPAVEAPQKPSEKVDDIPPIVTQPNQPKGDAPQVQAPMENSVDLTSAPEIKPAQRSTRNLNVAWPDAATHPDSEIADGSFAATEPSASDKKSKAELRALKKAKRQQEQQEKRAKKKDNRRRGRSLIDTIAGSIVSVVLVIFLIGGAWLVVESEYYDLFLEWRNGGPQEVTAEGQVSEDDFIPKVLNETEEQQSDWIEVFGPQDADKARGRGEVLVETIGEDDAGGIRVTSVNAGEFGEALIPLNGRLLAPAASKKFALAISVSVTEPTQVYVRCLLKSGIEIGRRRFQLGGGRTDVLIDLDMTDVGAFETQPYLAINSDISGGGKSIELYDVRFQVLN